MRNPLRGLFRRTDPGHGPIASDRAATAPAESAASLPGWHGVAEKSGGEHCPAGDGARREVAERLDRRPSGELARPLGVQHADSANLGVRRCRPDREPGRLAPAGALLERDDQPREEGIAAADG